MPETVAYLRDWFYAVYGRSGVSMAGAAPLTYDTITAWATAMGIVPAPDADEIAALMMLDSAYALAAQPKPKPPELPRQGQHGNRRR